MFNECLYTMYLVKTRLNFIYTMYLVKTRLNFMSNFLDQNNPKSKWVDLQSTPDNLNPR